ncbi:MAG TPA: Ig-like domain repeat protein [Bryobacteraceae bacterium]|nr:Ig-like domain repeat protein [Bryobacteraceae bacterium]
MSRLHRRNRFLCGTLAVAACLSTLTSLVNGQQKMTLGSPQRVSGYGIQVIELGKDSPPSDLRAARIAYLQGHIIRMMGGTPADLRHAIGASTLDIRSAPNSDARNGTVVASRNVVFSAVRLGSSGELRQFTSATSGNPARDSPDAEAGFEQWRQNQVSEAVGDPGPPADSWTEVLETIYQQTGDPGGAGGSWGSLQNIVRVYRLNASNTDGEYYMVLTDPQVSPNFSVPASNCASAFLAPCGWYTTSRNITISTSPAAILFDHGPINQITTGSGSWTIGAGIPGAINAGFSQNWSQPSVTTTDQSSTASGTGQWNEAFVSETAFTPLPGTSTSTFLSHQGAILKLPFGTQSFQLSVNISTDVIYQPSFGNPYNGGAGYILTGTISPPKFAVNPTSVTIAPGSSATVQLVANIAGGQLGLPWTVSNVPLWLNVSQTSGAATTLLTLTVSQGTALGTLGTLNFDTNPPFASPAVETGPLTMNVKVGRPDQFGVLLVGGSTRQSYIDAPSNTALLYSVGSNQFTGISQMRQPRAYHTSTLLDSGKILVAGGQSKGDTNSSALATAEIYDPSTGAFSLLSPSTACPGAAGCMVTPAFQRVATKLTSGKVLIAGGYDQNGSCTASAELFDPQTQRFSAVGNLLSPRCIPLATLLPSGEVLLAGGFSNASLPDSTILTTAELFDPTTNTFQQTGTLAYPTYGGTATLTSDGVLFTGGVSATKLLNSAQLYSISSGTFQQIANLNEARSFHTSTLLQNGQVLIAGGVDNNENDIGTAEIFDPSRQTFTLVSGSGTCPGAPGCLITPRSYHTDTALVDGRVFLSGGVTGDLSTALSSTEIFDPSQMIFVAGPTFDGRVSHTTTIVRGQSTTTLQSSQNPSAAGQKVNLTATVTVSTPDVLSGSVTFYDGKTVLGTSPLSNGTAALSVSFDLGQHPVSATYAGNGYFGPSSSTPLLQKVSMTPTSMTLTSNPNPSHAGAAVTFTAQLTATGGVAAPTGSVSFYDNANLIGTVPLSQTTAKLTTSSLTTGDHQISAAYTGDSNYAPDSSNTLKQSVIGVASHVTLQSSLNPAPVGNSVTFTATVTVPQTPGTAPTGRVIFADGSNPIGSGTLSKGTAAMQTSSLSAGSHQITANYSGNNTYASSLSPALTETISNQASKVTPVVDLSVNGGSSSTVKQGALVTFAARVHAAPNYPWPTGSITISDSTNAENRYGAANLTKDPASNDGLATISTFGMAPGNYVLIATYGGDNLGQYYNGAQSNTVTLTVQSSLGGPPPPQPDLAIYAVTGARNGAFVQMTLTVINNGAGPASAITLTQIGLRTLMGNGEAILVSPAIPLSIGTLAPGKSTVLNLDLQVPATIRKLRLSENGTFANGKGALRQFSSGQVVFP